MPYIETVIDGSIFGEYLNTVVRDVEWGVTAAFSAFFSISSIFAMDGDGLKWMEMYDRAGRMDGSVRDTAASEKCSIYLCFFTIYSISVMADGSGSCKGMVTGSRFLKEYLNDACLFLWPTRKGLGRLKRCWCGFFIGFHNVLLYESAGFSFQHVTVIVISYTQYVLTIKEEDRLPGSFSWRLVLWYRNITCRYFFRRSVLLSCAPLPARVVPLPCAFRILCGVYIRW